MCSNLCISLTNNTQLFKYGFYENTKLVLQINTEVINSVQKKITIKIALYF